MWTIIGGGNTQTTTYDGKKKFELYALYKWLEHKKLSLCLGLALAPNTSHLVELSLPNIYIISQEP